jgi:hypothetical protein
VKIDTVDIDLDPTDRVRVVDHGASIVVDASALSGRVTLWMPRDVALALRDALDAALADASPTGLDAVDTPAPLASGAWPEPTTGRGGC